MFGDVGHAIILIAFGLYLVVTEEKTAAKKNHNEIFNIFFTGRYVILLMGLFSLYTGLIYNDVFSKSVNIFGSSWHAPTNTSMLTDNSEINLDPDQQYSEAPYVFGVDPVWGVILHPFCSPSIQIYDSGLHQSYCVPKLLQNEDLHCTGGTSHDFGSLHQCCQLHVNFSPEF
jgi:hypothetical protein